ncbi:transposase, partial [Marinitenerispora sediminis]
LMPAHPRKGQRWDHHRHVGNAVLFRPRTGTPWGDLPERYAPGETTAGRHRRWSLDGPRNRIAERLRTDTATGEPLDISADSTMVRPHHHAAGAARIGDAARHERNASQAPGRPPGRADHQDPPGLQRGNHRRRGSRGGRPPAFDRGAHRDRTTVEHSINLRKQNRAAATGYGTRAAVDDGTIHVPSIRTRLRDLTRSTNPA